MSTCRPSGCPSTEIGAERQRIAAGEAIVFDPSKLHGLVNSGGVPMRYIVIIVREG